MVDISRPELLLAALKGKELACLLALQFAQGPVKVSWLGEVTGLSEHSLTSALDKLLALGLAGHNGLRSDWQTAPSLRDVLLERVKGQPSLGECMADLSASKGESEPQALAQENGVSPESRQSQVGDVGVTQEPAGHLPEREQGSGWVVTLSISVLPGAAIRGADECRDYEADDAENDLPDAAAANRGDDQGLGAHPAPIGSGLEQPATAIRGANEPTDHGAGDAELGPPPAAAANRGSGAPGRLPDQEVKEGGIKDLSPPALTSGISSSGSERSASQPIGAILAASELLFGEAVMGPPERYADRDLLLAHLADVYDRRDSLRKPARVVYANIKQGFLPAGKYRLNPLDYLPRDFLEAAGLVPMTEGEVNSGSVDLNEEPEDENRIDVGRISHSHTSIESNTLDWMVNATLKRSVREAWSMALASLRHMLPYTVYSETVEGLTLSRFDRETSCFYVAARDVDHAAWLEQRLRRTLERALTGACGLEAHASFLVEEL